MTSVSAGHIILTLTQPVGSGRSQRESNPGPPDQELRALPTESNAQICRDFEIVSSTFFFIPYYGNNDNPCYNDTLRKERELSLLPSSTVIQTKLKGLKWVQ